MELSDKAKLAGKTGGTAEERSENPEAALKDAIRLCQALLTETDKAKA